jgi:hypothetical protein
MSSVDLKAFGLETAPGNTADLEENLFVGYRKCAGIRHFYIVFVIFAPVTQYAQCQCRA